MDAWKPLFDYVFTLNVINFNALIHVMQKLEDVCLVFGCYEHMNEARVSPNVLTMRIMVSALCKEGKLERILNIVDETWIEEGLVIFKWMLQKNALLDIIPYSLVVFAKAKMGNLDAS